MPGEARLFIVPDHSYNIMLLIILNKLIYRKMLAAFITMLIATVVAAGGVEIESLDGGMHEFDKYISKGKWTVLNIWGTECPPCRDEMPDLVSFHDDHKDRDAIVVGIAIDFPSYGYAKKKEVIQFADDFMIDFPILLSDSSVTEQLGLGVLQGLPTTYMYTPEGELVGVQVGGINRKILEEFIKKYNKRIRK
jgi:thiol-disulfide isomerase/thioredoxin